MPRGVSLNEAYHSLSCGAITFGPSVKAALELWLQATEELPGPLQHPNKEDATPLIHAALRAAPRTITSHERGNFPWLTQHLPKISRAMQQVVSGQLDMAAKRISILQTLASKEQQSGGTQQSARFEAERNNCMFMEVRTLAFFVVLPVATLCGAMALAVHDNNMKYVARLSVNSVKLGSDLISRVAHSLRQNADVRAQLHKQKLAVQESLPSLSGHTPHALLSLTVRTVQLGVQAGHIWLKLVTTLPSSHPDVLLLLDHVDWEWLQHTIRFTQESHDETRALLSQLCVEYALLLYLFNRQPHVTLLVMQYLVKAEEVQASGLAESVQQRLLALMQRTQTGKQTDGRPDAMHKPGSCKDQSSIRQPSAPSGSTTDSSQGVRDGSVAADDKQQPGEEDLDDMHALLRMMYGSAVKV